MRNTYANAEGKKRPQVDKVEDSLHISQHQKAAVDKVRRREHKIVVKQGDNCLVGTKFTLLLNEGWISGKFALFGGLKLTEMKVFRTLVVKEVFRDFWTYNYADWVKRHFDKWCAWAIQSHLEPTKEKAKRIKNHMPNIQTYFKHQINNAVAEEANYKIQTTNENTRGYWPPKIFRNSILFYCSGLDIQP